MPWFHWTGRLKCVRCSATVTQHTGKRFVAQQVCVPHRFFRHSLGLEELILGDVAPRVPMALAATVANLVRMSERQIMESIVTQRNGVASSRLCAGNEPKCTPCGTLSWTGAAPGKISDVVVEPLILHAPPTRRRTKIEQHLFEMH